VGLASGHATTVAVVADLVMDRTALVASLADAFRRGGWSNPDELAEDYADDMVDEGEQWPVGARLRRRVDEVVPE
jgi:hypothetical protein